jgi:hypothetical protein
MTVIRHETVVVTTTWDDGHRSAFALRGFSPSTSYQGPFLHRPRFGGVHSIGTTIPLRDRKHL